MEDFCVRYKSQYKKAKETLDILQKKRNQIDFNLQSNASCAILHKELRDINLNIRITENEMEHAESVMIRHNQNSVI